MSNGYLDLFVRLILGFVSRFQLVIEIYDVIAGRT
jgi:hypothetical protein